MSDPLDINEEGFIDDPELVESFMEESREGLEAADRDLRAVAGSEDDPDYDTLDRIFRAVHSVKGTSGFLGLNEVSQLAMEMETVLRGLRDDLTRPDGATLEALFTGIGRLREMLDAGRDARFDNAGLIDTLAALAGKREEAPVPHADTASDRPAGTAEQGGKSPESTTGDRSGGPATQGGEMGSKNTEAIDKNVRNQTDREGKYLTFSLEDEEYGIEILKIREIIGMMPVTSIPQTPDFVKGVINLRGKVIPVIDLRLRFGMQSADYTDRTCIIVVEIQGRSGALQIGIVVDAVSEVLNIKAEEIEETPTFGTRLNTSYILGMAKVENGVRILLDIGRVLSDEEIASLETGA